jgi:hypothetical protein
MDYLEDFLATRSDPDKERPKDIILQGQVWIDRNSYHFRLKDLNDFLASKRFTEFKPNKITVLLKALKAEHSFFNISGKGVNVYVLPINTSLQRKPFNVPKQSGETPI